MSKKWFATLLISACLMVATIPFVTIDKNEANANDDVLSIIRPDKNIIENRSHVRKIIEFSEINDQKEKLNKAGDYLSKLSTKELLETAAEISLETSDYNSYFLLSSHFKEKFKVNAHYVVFAELIADKEYKNMFRTFMLDISTKINNQEGSGNPQIVKSMLSVAKDKTEDDNLRKYALLQLRGSSKAKADLRLQNQINQTLTEIYTSNNSEAIKGAAITAMKRTGHPDFENIVSLILSNPEEYSLSVKRDAVVNLAKTTLGKKYVKDIIEIIKTTDDSKLYASSMYALGIIGDKESIVGIVSNNGRFGMETAARATLKMNGDVIVSMLDENNDSNIILSAIKAAQIIKYETFIQPLSELGLARKLVPTFVGKVSAVY